jgi:hypothetical protein
MKHSICKFEQWKADGEFWSCLLNFSSLGNEGELGSYELNLAMKDYSLIREDCLVGLSAINLSHVAEQGLWTSSLPLGSHFDLDKTGSNYITYSIASN